MPEAAVCIVKYNNFYRYFDRYRSNIRRLMDLHRIDKAIRNVIGVRQFDKNIKKIWDSVLENKKHKKLWTIENTSDKNGNHA